MALTPPEIRRLLDDRAAQLEAEVAIRRRRDDGAPRDVGDRKDEADARIAEVVDDAEVARDLAELRDIARARQRLAEGRYGECVDCGQPIDAARLAARPAALRCMACQRAAEPGHGSFPSRR